MGIAIFRSDRVNDKFQLSHIKGLIYTNNFTLMCTYKKPKT